MRFLILSQKTENSNSSVTVKKIVLLFFSPYASSSQNVQSTQQLIQPACITKDTSQLPSQVTQSLWLTQSSSSNALGSPHFSRSVSISASSIPLVSPSRCDLPGLWLLVHWFSLNLAHVSSVIMIQSFLGLCQIGRNLKPMNVWINGYKYVGFQRVVYEYITGVNEGFY